MLKSCFEEIRQQLILCEKVTSFKVLKELYGNRDGFIRVKCRLECGEVLEFAEYLQISEEGNLVKVSYSYHWQAKSGELIRRWDNAPHHPEIATFPYHLHLQNDVVQSRPVTLHEVLKAILASAI